MFVLSLNTALSLGEAEKPPRPSSSLMSNVTSKLNRDVSVSGVDVNSLKRLVDFGTRRNAVAKLYRIFPT